jgi:hypothetical protein
MTSLDVKFRRIGRIDTSRSECRSNESFDGHTKEVRRVWAVESWTRLVLLPRVRFPMLFTLKNWTKSTKHIPITICPTAFNRLNCPLRFRVRNCIAARRGSYLIAPFCDTSKLNMAHATSRNYRTSRYDESDERAAWERNPGSSECEIQNFSCTLPRVSVMCIRSGITLPRCSHHDAATRM